MKTRKLRNVIASILATVMLVTLTGCASEKEEKPVAKGYMWKVENGENPMYLVGTMHPGSGDYTYINPTLEKVIDEVDVLGVEIDLTKIDPNSHLDMQVYGENDSIENYLNENEITKLKQICSDIGADYNIVKTGKPATINTVLSSYSYSKAGLTGDVTLDQQLITAFNSKEKEVVELEDYKMQLDVISQIYTMDILKEQINSYNGIEYFNEEIEYSKGLHDSFLNGTDEIPLKGIEGQQENPEVYNLLIKNRNVGMTEKIEGYLKEDKQYIIAVGYMHYFGEDSVVNMLKEKGYTVERVEI